MLTAGWSCLANDIELFTPPVCLTDCKKLFIKFFYLRKLVGVSKTQTKISKMLKSAQNYEISSKTGKTSKKQLSKMLKLTHYEFFLCFVWEYSPGEKTGPFRCTSKICKILSDWTSHGVSKLLTGSFFEAYTKS